MVGVEETWDSKLCFGPWPRLVLEGISPGVRAQYCFLQWADARLPSDTCDLHLQLSTALGNGTSCPASQFQRRGHGPDPQAIKTVQYGVKSKGLVPGHRGWNPGFATS